MQIKLFYILALGSTLGLSGCFADSRSIENHDKTTRIQPAIAGKYVKYSSSAEEYINRIAKRIVLISDQPNSNYHFKLSSAPEATIEINKQDNTVILSHGVLAQIHDEAELAAVLTLALGKIGNFYYSDLITINYLYRAGYDPQALVDLENRYLSYPDQMQWLNTIYTGTITPQSVAVTEGQVKKLPKGLLRGSDLYFKHISI